MARYRLLAIFLAALAMAGCSRNDGPVEVAFIDTPEQLFASGLRLSAGAQHLRAATDAGLVALDTQGGVVPALADRWIVTSDGRSYIFRLRDGTWPDGRALTADSVRGALAERLRALRGTSLGLDLAPIAEVRAMAGRVVEIRLSSPMPLLLQLLAQPELALVRGEDVQVLHAFDAQTNAQAYLTTALFERDIVQALAPLLDAPPDVRIYVVA